MTAIDPDLLERLRPFAAELHELANSLSMPPEEPSAPDSTVSTTITTAELDEMRAERQAAREGRTPTIIQTAINTPT